MQDKKRICCLALVWALIFGGLYLTSLSSYILFHTLAEIFRIAVAVAIFMLVWNVRRSLDNTYLIFVSVAYVFICGMDIVHTLAYEGMSVFIGYGDNLANQLWIGARYLEGASLFIAPFFLGRKLKLRFVLAGYVGATSLLLGTIFFWKVFPICFVDGVGLTPFKKLSEYAIVLILVASIALLTRKRDQFDPSVLRLLAASISFTVLSELSLSFYTEGYGFPFLLGHFFKIVAFYLIYRAIIEAGLAKPLAVLFRNLQLSEDALRKERDFIAGVFSMGDVMVAILDREGRIVRVNKAAERLTGYSLEEMKGKQPWDLVVPEEKEELRTILRQSASTMVPNRRENSFVAKDGHRFQVLWSSAFLLDEKGTLEYVVISGIDITERKRAEEDLHRLTNELDLRVRERTEELAKANELLMNEINERKRIEEALRKSETKYRTVADNTYDWEWWRDQEGNFIYTSPSCKKVTHREAEEFVADPDLLLRIIHPDDRPSFIRHQTEVEQRVSSGEIEFRILRPDGSLRWLAHACQPVFDEQGLVQGRRGSNRDITERKWVEEALRESQKQLRHLSSQILTAQETERRRISRELHDELGGTLAVLKLRASFIEKNLQKGQKELREECRQNLQYIDQLIENVHRLSRDLSPSILEDIGLTAALRWIINNFAKNYGIPVAANIENVDHLFPGDAQIMVYRIFQEALTNIGKHAQAKNVSVKVKRDVDRIFCFVEDDGQGFDVEYVAAEEASQKGFGMATMNERARMLGGVLDIWSEAGKGTRIALAIPLAKGENV